MRVRFSPKTIEIDDARITYRNFAGTIDEYNRDGKRSFSLVIPDQEIADAFIDAGFNVKIKPPRDEDDTPFITLPIKLSFNDRGGPAAYLITGGVQKTLDEESIGCLDYIDIVSVDMDIRPYDWTYAGKSGRSAYLSSIRVTQRVDRFAAEHADNEA